jgi:hypothetical protein
MPDARCPMPDARCPMPDARYPIPVLDRIRFTFFRNIAVFFIL